MNYKNYLQAVRQGFEDPTQYEPTTRCCEICNIEEIKTYFADNECICQDCKEEEEIEDTPQISGIPNGDTMSDTD